MPPAAPTAEPEAPRTWPTSAPWLVAGYAALGLGTILLAGEARSLGLNLLNTLIFAHAGLLMLARAARETPAARGWRRLALGFFAQACNQAWATVHMLRHAEPPPYPNWGDLGSVLTLILVISALLAWPLASGSGSERLRKGLDGLGAALAAFFLGWYFALGPLFRRPGSSPAEVATLVVFFLGNATILGICAYLGARRTSRFQGPLGWITAGFAVSTLQVILQVPLTLAGNYRLGDPLDLLVLSVAILLLLAPLAPQTVEPGLPPGAEIRDASRTSLLLPMLPAALALAVLLGSLLWTPGRLDAPSLGMVALLASLGLARGLLALRDLQGLSSALEAQVLDRTRSLESMQQAMLRTERMNAMAVLGAGMAHDLNNALATVRARAELARVRLEEGAPVEPRDLDHILVAADQSIALTTRLMAFGRQEAAPPACLCLREELASLETLLRMLLGRQTVLRLDLGAAPAPIRGSRPQLEQIFVNLVSNARDAMPEGGTIVVSLTLDTELPIPVARVEVADTGSGMPPEVLSQVFDPFFTTKPPGRGTGLGLASVQQLMLELGGTVRVASSPGLGTTFSLRFPLAT